ncbi:MAG: DUF21 domain-containing protein, partial [Candidatus Aminicenantes bacterium]|nr:DUF21 domain-containing protein [Candidatus Aminicenantes bacterium]
PGAVSLRSVNRSLKLKLDITAADTIGGYVTSLFGSIPGLGDSRLDALNNVKFEVLRMEGTRIDLLKIRPLKKNRGKNKTGVYSMGVLFCLLGLTPLIVPPTGAGASGGAFSLGVFFLLLILSLSLLAFYAGSETAVISASKARIDVLAHQDDKRALFIKKLMQEPDKMLGIVLVGTNLMATAAGVAGLRLTHYSLSGYENLEEVVNTIIMTFLILFFCEILPKTIFRAKADNLALKSAGALKISAAILRPLVSFVTSISNKIVRFAGEDEKGERSRIMREELILLAKMGQEEGALKKAQFRMIHSILDLEDRSIEKIMTPLIDVVAVPEDIQIQDFFIKVAETGYSRIPVYKDRIDNMVGVANVLDVLYSKDPSPVITPFIRKDIRHEPKTKRIFPLLRELTSGQHPMVFVVDEYGGIIGLVTIEDLVEEIMGDISDEKDIETEETIRRISERVFDCDGKAEILNLNHVYGLGIPEGDYITIAGYVVQEMQKIPKKGEILETDDLKILILDADAKKINRVRILQKQNS